VAYPRFDNFNSRFFEPILILSLQDLGSIARELALLSYCPAICELLLGSKRGRKMGKNALKYGAVAGVGALAWKAYQNYQTNTQQAATPSPSVEQQGQQLDQLARVPQEQRGLQILQAMIMAARADRIRFNPLTELIRCPHGVDSPIQASYLAQSKL
jgi:hypothetical protein